MIDIEHINQGIKKFSGFSKNTQNRLSNDIFADIHESIIKESDNITLKTIKSFFNSYFDYDITTISNNELKHQIEATVAIYTQRSSVIYDEIQELESLKKSISNAIDEIVFKSFDLESSIFSFIYKKRLQKLANTMKMLTSKMDELDQSMQRRARWSMDMVIGDYYILYMMFNYLYIYILEYDREDIRVFVTQGLNNLTQTVEESLKYYTREDSKIINRFIVLEFTILKDKM